MCRKIRLISKFVKSHPEKQIITIRVLSNISRSKCDQTMKLGKFAEYNMRNIFLEKSYTKYGGETIP